jgi:hypothetical protein
MPYTDESPSFVWLTTLGVCGLTAMGVVGGAWLLMFLLVTLATPILIVMSQDRFGVITRSRKHPRSVSDSRGQSPLDPDRIDVYRWESEGGAPRMYASSAIRGPVTARRSPQSLVSIATEAC